ncbi:hypothetical protein EAI_15825 [Harpegnathos saltator]|uniref:Uncharacterized protein n=1 Tax=Harpegnathos saltator TaxID=610380 RepID=E2C1D9_HARSA|nr:hypothetical protein EAI_15825 [Harpegnathos saltator]
MQFLRIQMRHRRIWFGPSRVGSKDAEDAEERWTKGGTVAAAVVAEQGDNEIEMAKADHRIGWLNGGIVVHRQKGWSENLADPFVVAFTLECSLSFAN